MTTATAREIRVPDGAPEALSTVHDLFVETLGVEAVEGHDSFRQTVSPDTDARVAPKLVATYEYGKLAGAMLGVYLRKVNGSMILYAGVREPFRRRGLYTEMRTALLSELSMESPTGPDFLLSEQEEDSWLIAKYLVDWGAFVAPLDYVQPAVQGLARRRLDLVVVPQAASREKIVEALPNIVRELYTSVYRIAEPEDNGDFRRVMGSIGMS